MKPHWPAPGELRASPFRGRLRSARYARLRSAAPGRGAQIAKNTITEQTLHRPLEPRTTRIDTKIGSLEEEVLNHGWLGYTRIAEKPAGLRLGKPSGASESDLLPSKLADSPISESLTRSASGPASPATSHSLPPACGVRRLLHQAATAPKALALDRSSLASRLPCGYHIHYPFREGLSGVAKFACRIETLIL